MKNLKFAIVVTCIVIGASSSGQDGDYDLDSVKTLEGRVYREIFIIAADDHGLMFRHDSGIAKVPYHGLSMNLRMLYEPVGEVDSGDSEVEESVDTGKSTSVAESEEGAEYDVLQASTRSQIKVPVAWIRAINTQMVPCRPLPWPSHWSRYHSAHAYAHALADPACRELAVRDFLYTTGLAERPPGVHPYAIPRHGPYCFR